MKGFHPKITAALWLLLMLFISALGSRALVTNWLETGFLALLPAAEQKPEIANAIKHHNSLRDKTLIWLVGAESTESAISNARRNQLSLQKSGLFATIKLDLPQSQMKERYQQLFPYRYELLTKQIRQALQTDPKQFLQRNLETVYSPLGQAVAFDLEHDPLFLLSRYLQGQNPVNLSLEQGVPVLQGQGKHWVLMVSELKDNHLQLDKLESLLSLVKLSQQQAKSAGCELLVTGMPLFTAAGADSAKQEISTVGLGASIGIFVLLMMTFRSVRPLCLSFLAVGSGVFGALIVSVLVFGKIHIITLVFGASLIGVADDYALHYVCDSFEGKGWRPHHALVHLFPGLVIGLLINLLSYSGLVISPFPALQEVAVFSAVGLLLAWLTVVLLFPLLLSGFFSNGQPAILKIADYWQRHWPGWLLVNRRWLIPAVAIIVIGGIWRLTPRDDVRLLQSAPEELTRQADRIKQLLPIGQDNQFFLVSGKTIAEWHQNEQSLLEELELLKLQNKLATYQGLSVDWPSEKIQLKNYQLLADSLYESGELKQYMVSLGFASKATDNEIKQFKEAKGRSISLSDWLKSADDSQRNLWLSCDSGRCSSIVALTGISDLPALAGLESKPLSKQGVAWVDQVGDLSSLFARYRMRVSLLLAAAYVAVFIGLGFKFGWRNAVIITAIPIFSALMSLAMLGWFNQLFSVFNIFALLLVLGIGVDDAIFFHLAGKTKAGQNKSEPVLLGETNIERRTSTSLAVTLSALTTLLAFGLLAVSATEIVHAFGFTVAIGIITALLCSPLVGYRNANKVIEKRR